MDDQVYDQIQEALSKDYVKLIQCVRIWKDVNRYHDTLEPEDCDDFYDWHSLICFTIDNAHLTQHIFDFNLE